MTYLFSILFAALSLLSVQSIASSHPLDQPFEIKVGEKHSLASTEYSVTLGKISQLDCAIPGLGCKAGQTSLPVPQLQIEPCKAGISCPESLDYSVKSHGLTGPNSARVEFVNRGRLCREAKSEDRADKCYLRWAVESKNPTHCAPIRDLSHRNGCLAQAK